MDAYVLGRMDELARLSESGLLQNCKTAYVGGGTPTFLGAERLGRLVHAVRDACPRVEELTCEANPDSLTDKTLQSLAGAGATRLSIGVQSLVDGELAALGRIHTAALAQERVRAAVKTGIDVSVDLMCAIPLQTAESWLRTLEGVLQIGVDHVSVYPLAIEQGTPLEAQYRHMSTPWNDEDVQADRMEVAERVLSQSGYERYEVASYALPKKQCRHNMAYWTGVPYLGLGPGAASMLDPAQYDLAHRLLGWPPVEGTAARIRYSSQDGELELLSRREAWAEDLMLGMRLTNGIEASRLDSVPEARNDLIERGLVALQEGRLVPTHDGWLLGNELFGALWDLACVSQGRRH